MGTFTHWQRNTTGDISRGGTRKIADAPPHPCRDPEHDPAGMIVREPGTYAHTCPTCGEECVFTVPATYM